MCHMDVGATASGPIAHLRCVSVSTSIGANGGACIILLHEMQEELCVMWYSFGQCRMHCEGSRQGARYAEVALKA